MDEDYAILIDKLQLILPNKPEVLERSPYRYVQCGTIELNGVPDYRIQKFDEWTKRYKDMYPWQ